MSIRSYSELISIPDFHDRFEYLKLNSQVGSATFSGLRYLNQKFYASEEWKRVRREAIARDMGCDLAHDYHPINSTIYIHHLNPITPDDLRLMRPCVFDLENLVCSSYNTHNAIHYGTEETLAKEFVERRPGDTCPWKNPAL